MSISASVGRLAASYHCILELGEMWERKVLKAYTKRRAVIRMISWSGRIK
jgi:hypothetical protein